jgi:hypothetical protein
VSRASDHKVRRRARKIKKQKKELYKAFHEDLEWGEAGAGAGVEREEGTSGQQTRYLRFAIMTVNMRIEGMS